ncbi:MAG TPA: glycosyltransferase family 4 protein [Stellaceae bacterium]|nr:glycosyltransferase family 4 protein [Stellaceae bacterium]
MGWIAAALPLGVFIGIWKLSGRVRAWLIRRAIFDQPGERSAHTTPTPRGGGVIVMPCLIAAWLALALFGAAPPGTAAIAAVAGALALLSWLDDLRSLPVGLRLLGHAVAVIVGLSFVPNAEVFQGWLSPLLDRIATTLIWVWFINLFNFMDGIDGITAIETASLGFGIALVAGRLDDDGIAALAFCAAAAGLAFLRWNWHPAKLFLGDSGSVPLGYLFGWLLFFLAARGFWASALILPLYYLADATLTLVVRVLRGEHFWRPHRQHFYQRALGQDGDHAAVARFVLAGDVMLVALAVIATARPISALIGAAIVVMSMLAAMQWRGRSVAG